MPGVVKGKAGYFSPEQAMGLPLDGRSDLFSVGVTLYKLACGNTPFDAHETVDARNTALLGGEWKPLEEVRPGLPEGFYTVLRKALQVKAGDRFATAKEMREALERVAVENGIHVGPSSLAGYVTADQEELAVVSSTSRVESGAEGSTVRLGDGPAPRPPAVPPPPPPDEVVGDSTMVLQKPAEAAEAPVQEGGLPLWIVGAGVGLGAAFVGAAVVLVAFGGAVQPQPVAAPVVPPAPVVAAVPPPVVEAVPAAVPALALEQSPAVAALSAKLEPVRAAAVKPALLEKMEAAAVEPKPEPVKAPEAEVVPVPAPAPKPVEAVRPAEPKPVVPAAAAREEAIAEGTGTLRIGSEPPGLKVKVGGHEGETPLQVKLASGRYTVEFTSADGVRGECRVKVLPDQTAKVKFTADGRRCE
jgi:serine/threonine-protein kinase